MNSKKCVDILNGISEKMEAKVIRFTACPHHIYADLFAIEFIDNGGFSIRLHTWKDIDDMFNDRYNNIANIVKYIDRKFFNNGDMRFLNILIGCSCWNEFMMKLQVMGYDV